MLDGGWNIADCVARSYDLEGMDVGTVAAGRIGLAVLRRLKPFDVTLHYTDQHRLPSEVEDELGLTFHPNAEDMVPHCDVVTINAPAASRDRGPVQRRADRHDEARRLPDEHRARQDLRPGCGRAGAGERSARRLRRRRLVSRSRRPQDHPWRTMPHHGMTPHISGSSLSAQARYAAGTREILECWFAGRRSARSTSSSTVGLSPGPAPTPTVSGAPAEAEVYSGRGQHVLLPSRFHL